MVNTIPDSWEYEKQLEMLFLFYQVSDELLSEISSDTYSLPLHNTMTLLDEIGSLYNTLNKFEIVNEYYSAYIPCVIDEFLHAIEQDNIVKEILNKRLDSIKTGFSEAKKNHILLERWIQLFRQSCSDELYREHYKLKIIQLITESNNKKDLIFCTKVFYISLMSEGYSREFLYKSVKRYFNNFTIIINTPLQIVTFLQQFSCQKNNIDFLILMDIYTVEYLDSISDNLTLSKKIFKVDIVREKPEITKDYLVESLIRDYDKMKRYSGKHQHLSIIRYSADAIDPFSAIEEFEDYIGWLQTFSRYFIHYYPSKQIYKILIKKADGYYSEIKAPNKLLKRPFVKQETIDSRISNILTAKSMSFSTFASLANAIQMHSEALDSRNLNTLLKNLWTAMESLFSNPIANHSKDKVLNGIVPIIQKTYILKLLRLLYAQLEMAIGKSELGSLEIHNFKSFILYFAANTENSPEMKKIYMLLTRNPLLRSRLYETRKMLSNGKRIECLLKEHCVRIEWQIRRLYRARNIATHIGAEVSHTNIIVNHLHNYIDFAINYVLCKSENGDYITSISAVVFEAQNDNKIYAEFLKNNEELTTTNYPYLLFGPDTHIIDYAFE